MNGKKKLTPHRRLLSVQSKISNTNNPRDIMPRIFHFLAKIQQKGVLCSNKMLLNRTQTLDRIFVQTINKRLREQITKFAKFHLHYFCTKLYLGCFDHYGIEDILQITKAINQSS